MATDATPAPTDAEIRKLAAIGAVRTSNGLVERRPIEYRAELEGQFVRGFRAAMALLTQPAASPAPVVAREPLTDAQADAIAKASFEKHCGRPHPWEGAQPWVIAAIKHADHGITSKEGATKC